MWTQSVNIKAEGEQISRQSCSSMMEKQQGSPDDGQKVTFISMLSQVSFSKFGQVPYEKFGQGTPPGMLFFVVVEKKPVK